MDYEETALQNRCHRDELARAVVASQSFPHCFFVGSTAAKALVPDKQVGVYLQETSDVDVVVSAEELVSFASKHGYTVNAENLVIRSASMGSYASTKPTMSPLTLFRLSDPSGMTSVFDTIDVFTNEVGVIPVDKEADRRTVTVRIATPKAYPVHDIELRVADTGYLASTHLNPVAYTERRAKRIFYPLLQSFRESSKERYSSEVVAVCMDYIRKGEARATALAGRIIGRDGDVADYSQYAARVERVGAIVDTNLKNEFRRAASRVGIRNDSEVETARRLLTERLRTYSTRIRVRATS